MREEREVYIFRQIPRRYKVQQERHTALQLECTDVSCTDVYQIRARSIGKKVEFILHPHMEYIILCPHFNKTYS